MEGQRRIFLGIIALALIAAGFLYYTLIYKKQPAKIVLDFPSTVQLSQEFDVPLKISTPVTANAAEFYFNFPPELVEVTTIDTTGSIFQLWITKQPQFDNSKGQLSFAGGLPTPGYSGNDGLIATVKFRAKQAGSGEITLDRNRSRILANDGLGTAIESVFINIRFTVDE
jgi:hypothetical protein